MMKKYLINIITLCFCGWLLGQTSTPMVTIKGGSYVPLYDGRHDVYNISEALSELFSGLNSSALSVSGLFLNADAGFDTEQFRRGCHEHEVFPNVAFNKRRGKQGEEEFLDELLYKQRYCIERTSAWMDSYRNVLNRFDKTLSSWKAWNYIAFILILLKKIRKGEKSR